MFGKNNNGGWYQVPVVVKGNYGFNEIAYLLASGGNREMAVDWKWLYGSLDKGEYRIVKDIMEDRHRRISKEKNERYYWAANFTITHQTKPNFKIITIDYPYDLMKLGKNGKLLGSVSQLKG